MTRQIPTAVEHLARAMCTSLEIDPDATFCHGADWSPYPRPINDGEFVPDIALYSPKWLRFAWQAHSWVFEQSGGVLPRSVGEEQ